MQCPICRTPVRLNDPYMPFCGERCQLLDLGNWASERYVISTAVSPADIEEPLQDREDDKA